MSFSNDTYRCARRKCGHIYKHDEQVYVPVKRLLGGPLKQSRGTCPKCGNHTFYIVKPKEEPNK
jgi:predicted  nucleic acid-binding Zn-ribbon protein